MNQELLPQSSAMAPPCKTHDATKNAHHRAFIAKPSS
jgi:hypothetical protein